MGNERRLIGAILIQAVKDWARPEHRAEVQAFLRSRWFGELAEAVQLEPADLRRKLMHGLVPQQPMRAAYRKK